MAACPSCRSPVDPADRFCARCGSPLSTDNTAPRVEHRLVTAVYVDLVGSTGLAETLDPENLSTLFGAVHAAVRLEVTERAGLIGAFVGDGVLGVFGLPTAHDDDPLRALQAAMAVLHRVEGIDEAIGRRLGVEVRVRVGVNTGELLVQVGAEDLGMLAGDTLNVAARLQELTEPGTILASERTARSVPAFRFEDLGLIDLRGRARPIHSYRALGESDVAPPRDTAPLHGRAHEMSELEAAYRRTVATGRPHIVTVVGNAGVGKSRLVREFIGWAIRTDPALTTLGGRCLPYGEDITYRPLVEVLADLTRVTSGSDPDEAAVALQAFTARYVGEEDAGTATEALMRMAGLGGIDTGLTPARVLELLRATWLSLLSGLAADGPVILAIEDVHWAGDGLLELVRHIAQRGEGPMLIVCAARPELLERNPDWGRDNSIDTVLKLEPIGQSEAQQLAAHLLAAAGLPVSAADRIVKRAGGNPFFIEELARELKLRSADHPDDDTDPLPATIHAVLSARIDLLEPEERRLLQAASVIGRIFWPSAVGAVVGKDPETLGPLLDRLEALQLVRRRRRSSRTGEPEYIFQHVLIREAAYGRLSKRDLAAMHAALAEWLDHHEGGAEAAERLAFHTWKAHGAAAATSGVPETEVSALRSAAVRRLDLAAESARDRAAFGRSRQLAAMALELAEQPLEQASALEQLGMTALAEYDGDTAWAHFQEAVDRRLEDPASDHAAIAGAAATAVETPLRWRGTFRQLPDMKEILRYLDIGMTHAGTADSEPLASLLTSLAFAPITPGPHGAVARSVIAIDEGLEAGIRARQMAQRLNLLTVESAALDALQAHALWGGRVQEAAAITSERLEIVGEIDDPWEVGDTHAMAAWLALDFGRFTLARDRALHGYNRTVDAAPSVALHNLSWATLARVQLGQWDEVAKALDTALTLLEPDRHSEPPQYAAPLFAAVAMVMEYRDEPDEADRLLEILHRVWSSTDLAERGGHPLSRWVGHTGPIFMRRGDYETVGELTDSDDAQPMGRESARLSVLCDLVAARASWDAVERVLDETRATASAYGLTLLSAHADRLEGRSSAATGDLKGGLALLTDARERFDAHGDHWEAGRTGLEITELGGHVEADYLRRFFADLGAVDELERARRLGTA